MKESISLPRTPHCSTSDVCNKIREWRLPDHHELSQVIVMLAAKIKDNGALSEKCKASIVDQLDEIADEIDQDLVNQQEQTK